MSRAFVRESDNSGDDLPPARPQLPPGVKNYITPAGAQRMQSELTDLLQQKRRLLESQAGVGMAGSDQERRKLESRIRVLQQRLQTLVVTPPPANGRDSICFGATVLVRNLQGEEISYRIVGIDETDLDKDHISWRSPLARALLSRRVGDQVRFDAPSGTEELHILSIAYEES